MGANTPDVPKNVKIVPVGAFTQVSPHGELDFETSRDLLNHLVFSKDAPDRIMIDLRDADWQVMRDADLFKLIDICTAEPCALSKHIVFLDGENSNFSNGEFFELLARHKGLKFRSCTDFEKAVEILHQM